MIARLVPLNDRIIVKRLETKEEMYKGAIHIPDVGQETPQEGIVIAVGPGKPHSFMGFIAALVMHILSIILNRGKLADMVMREEWQYEPVGLKKGDRVLFGKFSGSIVKVAGEELLIMRPDELFAKIEFEAEAETKPPTRRRK